MGQAKARGTFEERKREAIERQAQKRAQLNPVRRRPRSVKKLNTVLSMAIGLAAATGYAIPGERPLTIEPDR